MAKVLLLMEPNMFFTLINIMGGRMNMETTIMLMGNLNLSLNQEVRRVQAREIGQEIKTSMKESLDQSKVSKMISRKA